MTVYRFKGMAHDNIYNIYFMIQILDCLFYYVSYGLFYYVSYCRNFMIGL